MKHLHIIKRIQTQRVQRLRAQFALATTVAFVPLLARAQTEPGANELTNLVGWMTGTPATLFATLMCAASGWAWWTGRMNPRWGAGIIGGTVLVFGSAQIVTWLTASAT